MKKYCLTAKLRKKVCYHIIDDKYKVANEMKRAVQALFCVLGV